MINITFKELKGKIFTDVDIYNIDKIIFKSSSETIVMYHAQDCCESVTIDDINGDLENLINTPILYAEESSHSGFDDGFDSYTWTFYKLGTINGWVDIRWHGVSNGYYSERVSLAILEEGDNINEL